MKSLFKKQTYCVLEADGTFKALRPWVWGVTAFLALCLITIWWMASLLPQPPPTAAVQAAEFKKELSQLTDIEQKKLMYGAEMAAKQAQEEKIKSVLGVATLEEAKAKMDSSAADNGKLLLDNIALKEKLDGSVRKTDIAAAQEKVVAELGAKNAEIKKLTSEITELKLQLNGSTLAGAAQPAPAADASVDDAARIANANRGAASPAVDSDRQFLRQQPQPRPAAGPTPRPTVTQRRAAQQPAPAQASGPVDRGYAAQIIAAAQSGAPLTVRPVNPNDPEIRIKGDPGEKGIRYSELKRIDPNFSVRLQ